MKRRITARAASAARRPCPVPRRRHCHHGGRLTNAQTCRHNFRRRRRTTDDSNITLSAQTHSETLSCSILMCGKPSTTTPCNGGERYSSSGWAARASCPRPAPASQRRDFDSPLGVSRLWRPTPLRCPYRKLPDLERKVRRDAPTNASVCRVERRRQCRRRPEGRGRRPSNNPPCGSPAASALPRSKSSRWSVGA